MYTILRTSVAESGFSSLYTGLSASILRQMTYTLIRFGAYEKIKEALSAHGPPSTAQLLLAAMVAGGIGGVAGNPAGESPLFTPCGPLSHRIKDILFVRIISDSVKPPSQRYNYKNLFSGFTSIIRTEGFKGLTRGLDANTVRMILPHPFYIKLNNFYRPERYS